MPSFSQAKQIFIRRKSTGISGAVDRHIIRFRRISTSTDTQATPATESPIPSLSARLSFVFDQIDALDRARAEKDDALNRIRSWRQAQPTPATSNSTSRPLNAEPQFVPREVQAKVSVASTIEEPRNEEESMINVLKKDVELVHPWPEWIELMQRLAQQNYFDFRRCDENRVAADANIDLSGIKEEMGLDFSRDWTTVRNACMNFGRDRFDILRSLSRKDIQIIVGHGCPSMDSKVVFSAKLLRKLVHLDEGDVCSSCNLRNSCTRGYILTRKEDEARTLDVMRILLTFSFDHVIGSVENKPLMKMKSLKTVVRKLLHEVVKLSAIPIDPNLPPPIIKKPPPKVKQPPPPPKKRVGRDDVEMKKGDWLCSKCDFMNFAKNTVCLQCDAKRPKRQLLPGEWECPGCNFLNYRRNMACFHCDHKRPPDTYTEDQQLTKQPDSRIRMDRTAKMQGVSNAWNFDFDDNESDGADVAAFEFADSRRDSEQYSLNNLSQGANVRDFEDDTRYSGRSGGNSRGFEEDTRHSGRLRTSERGGYFKEADDNTNLHSHRTGFDDFEDEEEDDVNSYELEGSNVSQGSEVARRSFSELEESDSEGYDEFDRQHSSTQSAKDYSSGSEADAHADHPYWRPSRHAASKQNPRVRGGSSYSMEMSFVSDDDEVNSDDDIFVSERQKGRQQGPSHRAGKERTYSGELPLRYESDDDGSDLNLGQNKRVNNYSSRDSRKEFGNVGRINNRRASFDNHQDDIPRRGSGMHGHPRRSGTHGHHRGLALDGKGPRRSGHSRFRDNDEVQQFDTRERRTDYREQRRFRDNDKVQQFDRQGDRRGINFRKQRSFRDNDKNQQFDRQGDRRGTNFRQQRRRD